MAESHNDCNGCGYVPEPLGKGKSKMKGTNLICLNAVACSGKTTYMKAIAGLNDVYPSEYEGKKRPLTLSIGGFFRETVGAEFFKDLPNPGSPEITDHWVNSMMHHSLNLAYFNNMDVITDSFPRKPRQLEWLMNSSFASTRNINVEMRFLYVDEDDHKNRINERMALCESSEEKAFLQQRIDTDRATMIEVHQLTKKMIASENYKALSIKEVTI